MSCPYGLCLVKGDDHRLEDLEIGGESGCVAASVIPIGVVIVVDELDGGTPAEATTVIEYDGLRLPVGEVDVAQNGGVIGIA